MKKTIRIDEDFLREVRSARGAETDTEPCDSVSRHWFATPLTSVCAGFAGRNHRPGTYDGVASPRPAVRPC